MPLFNTTHETYGYLVIQDCIGDANIRSELEVYSITAKVSEYRIGWQLRVEMQEICQILDYSIKLWTLALWVDEALEGRGKDTMICEIGTDVSTNLCRLMMMI